jgi:hypothetical protein
MSTHSTGKPDADEYEKIAMAFLERDYGLCFGQDARLDREQMIEAMGRGIPPYEFAKLCAHFNGIGRVQRLSH